MDLSVVSGVGRTDHGDQHSPLPQQEPRIPSQLSAEAQLKDINMASGDSKILDILLTLSANMGHGYLNLEKLYFGVLETLEYTDEISRFI